MNTVSNPPYYLKLKNWQSCQKSPLAQQARKFLAFYTHEQ